MRHSGHLGAPTYTYIMCSTHRPFPVEACYQSDKGANCKEANMCLKGLRQVDTTSHQMLCLILHANLQKEIFPTVLANAG